MTTRKRNTKQSAVGVVAGDRDLMKALMKEAQQDWLDRHQCCNRQFHWLADLGCTESRQRG